MSLNSVLSSMVGTWLTAAILLTGITIKWLHFESHLYPYTISQPSSYTHQVIQNTAHQKGDYFFPGLGSYVTNVNIFCDSMPENTASYFAASGGLHVRHSGTVMIMGKRRALIAADFHGIGQRFTIEQTSVRVKGRVWHLTMSYAEKFRSQRPLMLHMLRTFHAN